MLGDHAIVDTDRANGHPGFVTVVQHSIARRGNDGAQERLRAVEECLRMAGGLKHHDIGRQQSEQHFATFGKNAPHIGTGPRDVPKHRYRRGRSLGFDQRGKKRQMKIMNPHLPRLSIQLLQHRIGKTMHLRSVGRPKRFQIVNAVQRDMAQRPQNLVGIAKAAAVDFIWSQPDAMQSIGRRLWRHLNAHIRAYNVLIG